MRLTGLLPAMAIASLAWLAAPGAAAQIDYPNRPIKIVVGFPPGTAADTTTRLLAPKLGELLKTSVVVENKPGASSTIGAESVLHAPADGYALFMGTISNTVNPAIVRDLPFDFATDFAPIALVSTMPNILIVHPSVPAASVAALIALAKAKPGQLTYGSAGTGTILHLSGELFNTMAGVKLVHVPYKGSSQAITDLLGGQIATMFAPVSTALPQIRAGTVRALATTGRQRTAVAGELPTMTELGFAGFVTGVWCGLLAPAATPRSIVARLADAIERAQNTPDLTAAFAAQGIDMLRGGPDDFARYIRDETAKWSRVMANAQARND
jgi:tripartite-type tricarboxylate transporter receptor subunit TctC